ncbi:MAG: hypothetical protein ACYDGX_03490 [Thermoleophilia bacterium]
MIPVDQHHVKREGIENLEDADIENIEASTLAWRPAASVYVFCAIYIH